MNTRSSFQLLNYPTVIELFNVTKIEYYKFKIRNISFYYITKITREPTIHLVL